ncbi:ribosomal RNA-processing protein 7 [Helicosporidium sp. ATCC 50920]|nr:ribosomal RNA-processing protein 7 [Helicosporidium sp. ATCC 50920]|eukprot:KDD72767.1 ribosomal RNA-processing protein 7 [Helicosporidium sp. ATCC 50920]
MASEASTSYSTLRCRLRKDSPVVRCMYIRETAGDAGGAGSKGRRLYVAGIPAALHEAALLDFFGRFGEVERIALHASGLSAIVEFAESSGRRMALRRAAKGEVLDVNLQAPAGACGLKGWIEAEKQAHPGNATLQQELDEWTEAFEAEEAAKRQAALAAVAGDGWTVVRRSRGKNVASSKGSAVASISGAAAKKIERRQDRKTFDDFYQFQQREEKTKDLLSLRAKFEEDKKRIAELRTARRFKPY